MVNQCSWGLNPSSTPPRLHDLIIVKIVYFLFYLLGYGWFYQHTVRIKKNKKIIFCHKSSYILLFLENLLLFVDILKNLNHKIPSGPNYSASMSDHSSVINSVLIWPQSLNEHKTNSVLWDWNVIMKNSTKVVEENECRYHILLSTYGHRWRHWKIMSRNKRCQPEGKWSPTTAWMSWWDS